MSSLLEALVASAFDSSEAREANQAIARVRAEVARRAHQADAHSYEVAVPALGPDEYLKENLLPKLVYYLDCHGVSLPGAPGVFVSLFTPEGLYFLESSVVVSLLAEARGLSLDEVRRRYGERGKGEPLSLGG